MLCGICDRFVQLAFAVTLETTVAFLFMPWASILFAAATVALALVCSRLHRLFLQQPHREDSTPA